jgi:hypothetical protein
MLKLCGVCKEQFEARRNMKYCQTHSESEEKRKRNKKYYKAWDKRNRIKNNERRRIWKKENSDYIKSLN